MSYISEPYMHVGTTSPPFLVLQPCPIFVVCEKTFGVSSKWPSSDKFRHPRYGVDCLPLCIPLCYLHLVYFYEQRGALPQ